MTKHRPTVPLFLFITAALGSVFYYRIIRSGHLASGHLLYVAGLMWCPGIAAIITVKITRRKLSSLGWRFGNVKYIGQSYLLPVLYAAAGYGLIWSMNWGGFYNREFVSHIKQAFGFVAVPAGAVIAFYFLLIATVGIFASLLTALGEEIGWRGYLVPALYPKFGYTKTSLLSGIIWCAYHYPVLLFADYNAGTPAWYGLACFTILAMGISFVLTWYRVRSRSLWPAAVLHATHNIFIQSFFTPLTVDTGYSNYYIGEFGAVLPVLVAAIAILFWRKRRELPAVDGPTTR